MLKLLSPVSENGQFSQVFWFVYPLSSSEQMQKHQQRMGQVFWYKWKQKIGDLLSSRVTGRHRLISQHPKHDSVLEIIFNIASSTWSQLGLQTCWMLHIFKWDMHTSLGCKRERMLPHLCLWDGSQHPKSAIAVSMQKYWFKKLFAGRRPLLLEFSCNL